MGKLARWRCCLAGYPWPDLFYGGSGVMDNVTFIIGLLLLIIGRLHSMEGSDKLGGAFGLLGAVYMIWAIVKGFIE
jgi:hypothetical protein